MSYAIYRLWSEKNEKSFFPQQKVLSSKIVIKIHGANVFANICNDNQIIDQPLSECVCIVILVAVYVMLTTIEIYGNSD